MAYNEEALLNLGLLKTVTEKVKTEYEGAIAESRGTVYTGTKTSLETSDTAVIEAFFGGTEATEPKRGDVFVVATVVDGTDYEKSAYIYDGESWAAMAGNVDAEKVIMRSNIVMAGDYTQVGNKTKTQNGTSEFETSGKSVAAILTDIFSKRLQPTITAQPSVSGFALTGAKTVEAGTKLTSADYTAATLNAGTYKYGPATGVTATKWVVQRITDSETTEIVSAEAASLTAGSDTNDGAGFVIGDSGDAVSTLKYKVTATHTAGVTAYDNLGSASDPVVSIAAGTKTSTTSAYTPFRNYFYGATVETPTVDSDYIRSLTKSGKAYASGTVTISVPAGAKRVVIACITGKTGVTKVINETAMNADVTSTFTKQTVSVEGANGYTAKEYTVWTFEPAAAYENAATLKVTLG